MNAPLTDDDAALLRRYRRGDAAAFNAAIGRVERSTALLASFEALDSPNTSAWLMASETYVRLGDIGSANRAILCATDGQVGCWPAG